MANFRVQWVVVVLGLAVSSCAENVTLVEDGYTGDVSRVALYGKGVVEVGAQDPCSEEGWQAAKRSWDSATIIEVAAGRTTALKHTWYVDQGKITYNCRSQMRLIPKAGVDYFLESKYDSRKRKCLVYLTPAKLTTNEEYLARTIKRPEELIEQSLGERVIAPQISCRSRN